jgi:pimeloyl-ACP methyl ester carboxylesterase
MDHGPIASDARVGRLEVPGASIHYEVRGKGPALLIIPGGPQDAGVFAELARRLADRYTVVTYDPRGNSRSPFEGPLDVDQQADDAAALIENVGKPAFVFGTSGGAQIALNLAARHPSLVCAVVAHEPPAILLLEDPAPALAEEQDLFDIYRREGVEAAMAKFFADNGLEGGDEGDPTNEVPPMSPEDVETFARVSGNFEYWLAEGMKPLAHYEPDVAALKRRAAPRIVVAIGEGSAGQPIAAMGQAVAERLGLTTASFPGDHMGFASDAIAFAEALHRSFTAR